MKAKPKLVTPILGAMLVLIVVLMIVASQQGGPTFTPPTLPANNGYDKLLEAAKLLAPRTDFYDEMDEEELEKIVEQNRPALKMVSAALDQPISVPVDWSQEPGSAGSLRLNSINSLRSISRALMAQAFWQRNSDDHAAATKTAELGLDLGSRCGQGGLLNDHFVGVAIRGMGLDAMRKLDVDRREVISSALTSLTKRLHQAESIEQVLTREKEYIRATSTGIVGWQLRRNLDAMLEPSAESARAVEHRVAAQERLLQLHLASRLFYLDAGKWPSSLGEIPIASLSPVRLDPFSNQPFIYRLTDDGYQLYSVGENKIDDGGQTDEDGLQPDLFYDLVPTP